MSKQYAIRLSYGYYFMDVPEEDMSSTAAISASLKDASRYDSPSEAIQALYEYGHRQSPSHPRVSNTFQLVAVAVETQETVKEVR